MTSDAKIGLLLGLVFIFIIAFIVNGLPRFHKDKSTDEMTTNVVRLQNESPGLAAREREASKVLDNTVGSTSSPQGFSTNPAGGLTQMTSPTNVTSVGTVQPTATGAGAMTQVQPTAQSPAPVGGVQGVVSTGSPQVGGTNTLVQNPGLVPAGQVQTALKQEPQKTYTVCEGDSLATIAIKFYGAEGKKPSSIDKIFTANKNILKSRNEIFVGQRLVIPAMTSGSSASSVASSSGSSAKAESAGKSRQATAAVKEPKASGSSGEYVVAEGDSLWKIAASKLGDGSRYNEIVRLNREALADEDRLEVGLHLKMPAK